MTRKIKIIIAGLILGLFTALISGYFIFKGQIFEIIIEKSEIQNAVSSKLPFQKTYFLFINATVEKAEVILENGSDRIGLNSGVKLNILLNDSKELLGCSFSGSGKIRYEITDASFYLDDLKIDSLDIQGIPEKYQDKVRSIVQYLLKDHFSKKAVYKLDKSSVKIQLARAVLKDVKTINGKLYIYLGY